MNQSLNRRHLELSLLLARFVGAGVAGYSLLRPVRPHHWRHFAKRHSTQVAKKALKIFGVELEILHPERLKSTTKRGRLFLCNHHSYFDGLLIASAIPGIFVTSVEAQSDLVQGLLAKIAGSLFVERRNKTRLVQDIAEVAKALGAGFSVAIFPEGKTGNGSALLPFKSALIQAAIDAEAEIVPLCLNYQSLNDQPIRQSNCELVFFHGKLEFLPHLQRLLRDLFSLRAEIHVLEAIQPHKGDDRRELGAKVRSAIESKFQIVGD